MFDPEEAKTWNNKGNIFFDQKKYDNAIKCYNKAVDLDPNYANAWKGKGNVFFDQTKYGEALRAYEKAIELDPNYADAWYKKDLLFLTRASTIRPSRLTMRLSGLIPTMLGLEQKGICSL